LSTGLLVLGVSVMPADFSYQETHTITGGALVGAMKVMGVFSKNARKLREPIQSSVAIKGDRMVQRSPDHMEIIDLGNQTFTSVDLEKKTYTVMTFEEMKQMLAQAQEKMAESKSKAKSENPDAAQVDTKFKIAAKNTGKTKELHGLSASERVITAALEATDQKSGQSGSMVMVADQWIAPNVAGYDEVRNFQRRMAEKLNWTPNSNMLMGRPDMSQGMAEVAKETAKLDGIPVFQTLVMGPEGTQPVDRSEMPAGQKSEQKGPSMKSAIGGALGGRFGLGRKKAEPPPEQQQGDTAAGQGVLIEMTTETTNFSSAPVDASMFEVPADFKKVDSDLKKMR
jgi:hypothetical protein